MSRKKKIGSFGLSMLDIVSNSLAAVIILFLILSTLRAPSIPIERICGTGIVEIEIIDAELKNQEREIGFEVFIKPGISQKHGDNEENFSVIRDSIYWAENISNFQEYFDRNEGNVTFECDAADRRKHPQSVTITRNKSKEIQLETKHTITFKNPPRNLEFNIGALYTDHVKINFKKKPLEAKFTITWQHAKNEHSFDTIVALDASTVTGVVDIDWGKIIQNLN